MNQSSKQSEPQNKAESNGLRPFILDPKNSKIEGNGLRDFITDPKASVKKYIETSMGPSNPSQQPGQWNQASGSSQDLSNPPLPQRPHPNSGRVQSYTGYSTEGPVQVPQYSQAQYVGSNPVPAKPTPLVDYSNFSPPPSVSASYQHQETTSYGGVATPPPDSRLVGPAPPPAEPQARMTLPAPRLYHRMITEYETIKAIFYAAKSQPTHNDLSPLASRLKFLSREIWNIRYTRASEFPYSEATTEERITEWKAQFEYWTDVLEDLLDPRYVAKVEREAKEDDWAGIAGLVTKPAVTKKAAKVSAAEDEAPAPVKKKVSKTVAADGDAAPVGKKKKVVKKTVAAE